MSFLAAKHVGSISIPASGKEQEADEYQPLEKAQLEFSNLTSMSRLHELNVVENLNHRYLKKPPQIYTAINNILLAVNPYQDLGIYSSKHITQHAKGDGTKDPHIFSVTNRAYRQLIRDEQNQSILICGESGSGKTETAKYAMRFLTSIGPKGKSSGGGKKKAKDLIEQQIIAVNPVLEAFGNAKTTMNNNSSRFAKFTQILFSEFQEDPKAKTIAQKVRSRAENARIVGSAIQTYLLEKPRVVRQAENEKNFHIFYQIFHLPKDKLKEYGLTDQKDFKYLGDTKTQTNWVEGQQNMYTKKAFEETCNSLKTLGFSEKQSEEMFRCVAGVLHLGNVMFAPEGNTDRDRQVELSDSDKSHIKFAAKLFGIEEDGLTDRLTMELMKAGRDVNRIPYSVHKALSNRDSIARNIYEGVFNYLVKGLNKTLHKKGDDDDNQSADHAGGQPYIGVLDVFGFENFTVNSFEQYSINYANETLQQLFDKTVIGDERLEYIKEGVFWGSEEDDGMDKGNSEICLVLLDKIYHSLDEQCRMDRTAENFVSEIHSTIAGSLDDLVWLCLPSAPPRKLKGGGLTPNALSPRSSGMLSPRSAGGRTPRGGHRRTGSGAISKESFRIQHYAGEVAYTATQFLDKNKDRVVAENAQLFGTSNSDLVKILFEAQAAEEPQQGRKRKKAKGIGGVFRDQMSSLMTTLAETGCHFVRCLNPNNVKKKGKFDDVYITGQLRAGGIVAALEVMKKGFPTRKEFQAIKDLFANCKPLKKQHENMGARDFVQFLLIVFKEEVPDSCYKLGNSKLFFKPGEADKLDLLSESTESISKKQVAAAEAWFKSQRLVKLRGFAKASGAMIKALRYRRMRAKVQPLCHGIIFMGSMALAQKRRYAAADTIKTWYRTRSEEKNFNRFMEFCAGQLSASGGFSDMSQDEKIDALAEASSAKWGIERQEREEVDEEESEANYDEADDREAGEAGDSDYDAPKKSAAKEKKSGGVLGFFGGSSSKADESDDAAPEDDDEDADDRQVAVRGGRKSSSTGGSGSGSGGAYVPNETVEALIAKVEQLERTNNELAASQLRLAESMVRMRRGGKPDSDDDDPISDLDEHVRRLTELTSGIDTKMGEWQPLKKPGRTSGDLIQTIFTVLLIIQVVLLVIGQIPHAHNPRYAMLKAVEEFRPYYTHVMDNYVSPNSS